MTYVCLCFFSLSSSSHSLKITLLTEAVRIRLHWHISWPFVLSFSLNYILISHSKYQEFHISTNGIAFKRERVNLSMGSTSFPSFISTRMLSCWFGYTGFVFLPLLTTLFGILAANPILNGWMWQIYGIISCYIYKYTCHCVDWLHKGAVMCPQGRWNWYVSISWKSTSFANRQKIRANGQAKEKNRCGYFHVCTFDWVITGLEVCSIWHILRAA